MPLSLLQAVESAGRCRGHLSQLKSLYAKMDEAYRKAADHYGFVCEGCEDNCCRTRFYHHTLVEFLYLASGWIALEEERRAVITARALEVCREGAVRRMCPLNEEGRCVLYAYRPMICRLHGLPHELRRPGMQPAFGPGCGEFDARCGGKRYFQMDRTPHYFELARLERELRRFLGCDEKFKKTVAEMLADEGD